MSDRERIKAFFDGQAAGRDVTIESHAVVHYEQKRRQAVVLEFLQPAAGERILDIGCGNGRDVRLYAARGVRIVGADFSMAMLQDAGREMRALGRGSSAAFVQADATRLPFASAAFDKVVCSEVIEHIPEAMVLLTEAHRVLRPGGCLVLTTPNRRSLYGAFRRLEEARRAVRRTRDAAGGDGHPYDEWKTTTETARLLQGAGFVVVERRTTCYIPSHAAYSLPASIQRLIVSAVERFERAFGRRLRRFGYTIAVAARKP